MKIGDIVKVPSSIEGFAYAATVVWKDVANVRGKPTCLLEVKLDDGTTRLFYKNQIQKIKAQ